MQKLHTTPHTKLLIDKLIIPLAFIEAMLIFLCASSEHKIFFICISVITFTPLMLKWKYLSITFVSVAVIFLIYFLTKPNNDLATYASGSFKINKVITMGGIVSIDNNDVLIKTKEALNQYDVINLKGSITKVVNTSEFDLVTYLKSLNVFYIIDHPVIKVLERSNDIRIKAQEFVTRGGEWYEQVTPLVFLGDKNDLTKEIYKISVSMNVVHLFVISGFHISLFYSLIYKPLTWLKLDKSIASWIALLPIWIYLFFLNFPISALRAVLLTTLLVCNREILKSKFSTIEALSFVLVLIIFIDPMSVFSLSFIFTFIATYVIVFINQLSIKSKSKKYILFTIFAYASNVFIAMYTNHNFAVFGILFGIFLTPLFVLIYSLTLFLFPFKEMLNQIDYYFIFVMRAFNHLNILVTVPKFNINFLYATYGVCWSFLVAIIIYKYFQNKFRFLF